MHRFNITSENSPASAGGAVDLSLAVFLKHAFTYILPYTGPGHHRARFFIRKNTSVPDPQQSHTEYVTKIKGIEGEKRMEGKTK